MVSEEYVEAVVLLTAPDRAPRVETWLTSRGLSCQPIQLGLLAHGRRETFDAVFGTDLQRAELPLTIPVPPELSDAVSSIEIPAPRRYH
jgi:hypothetical protein